MDDLTSLSRAARKAEEVERDGRRPAAASGTTASAAGWFPDPSGRHQLRYWDGTTWTGHVRDQDVAGVDPP
jgi:hypothetical protein